MDLFRNAKLTARFVLVWIALTMGVAIASPLVNPKSMHLVCTGTGAIKVVVSSSDSDSTDSGHTLDCPLCTGVTAPPPVALWKIGASAPTHQPVQSIATLHVADSSAAPLPARGPPPSI